MASAAGMRVRQFAKRRLYDAGVLAAAHRAKNANALTVVLFHRVLPRADTFPVEAAPAWTVPLELFRECLGFFSRHYNPVGLPDVEAACGGGSRLPSRPLLITFDDGWADTAEHAAPALARAGIPAAIFVVAEGIGQDELWQEKLLRNWRNRRLRSPDLDTLWRRAAEQDRSASPDWNAMAGVWALIDRLSSLTAPERDRLLSDLEGLHPAPWPQMCSAAQLRALRAAGFSIGSHGMTHTPVPRLSCPETGLASSRTELARVTGAGVTAFSFPRGLYDSQSVRAAEAAGFKLLFTSDEHLNRIDSNSGGRTAPSRSRLCTFVFGRIHIPGHDIADAGGRLCPESLAMRLFTKPIRAWRPQ